MNYRIKKFVTELLEATRRIDAAVSIDRTDLLSDLMQQVGRKTQQLDSAIHSLKTREICPHFQQAKKLRAEGWSATRNGNDSIDSSIVYRNGQRYYLLPADRNYELRLSPTEGTDSSPDLQTINLNVLADLERLTEEAGDLQPPTFVDST